MKKKLSHEKLSYIIVISFFLLLFTVLSVRIHQGLEELRGKDTVVVYSQEITDKDKGSLKTVYVTPSGKSYHLKGCSYLGDKLLSVSKQEAIDAGYFACSKCHP